MTPAGGRWRSAHASVATRPIAAAANVAATGILDRAGHELSFARFLLYGVPVTLISLAIAAVYLLIFQL